MAAVPRAYPYVLENRQVMKRAFPAFFPRVGVQPVADYSSHLLNLLKHIAPQSKDDPTVVLLTPGVYNSAYFEHCFLARQMGVEIVEGRDLFVENKKVYSNEAERLCGKLISDILYSSVDEIIEQGIHDYLKKVVGEVSKITLEISNQYMFFPVIDPAEEATSEAATGTQSQSQSQSTETEDKK
ncbi:MAG: hypothetical protein ACI9R3_004051 [Verrucomicrobiales bacterium]|jgi:hypothetical protein